MATPPIALIGLGHSGAYHLSKLQRLEREGLARLVGVVDIAQDVREQAARDLGVPSAARLADLPERPAAVVLATPSHTHADLGCEALALGCHVLVEKPMASSVAEAQRLADAAHQAGRILQVGHSERFNPALRAALAVADRPRYIEAERLGPFTGRSVQDDVIFDLMIHDLDLVGHLVSAPLVEVRALGVPVLTQHVDMANARLTFGDGSVAQLSAGRASLEPCRKVRLFTMERYLSVDCLGGHVKSVRRLPPPPGQSWPEIAGEPVRVVEADALYEQARAFVQAVASGTPSPVAADAGAGLRAVQWAEQIRSELKIPLEPQGA